MKKVSKTMIEKYKDTFPALGKLRCKCEGGNHSPTCGCLNLPFISKAHTNFSSILMEAQSQEEFVKRLEALPSGREEGVTSTHFGSARAKSVVTNNKQSVRENRTKPE